MVSSRPRQRPGAGEGEQNMSPSSCLGQKPEAIFLRWINIFHLIRTPHRKFYLLSFIILIRNVIKTCVVCLPCARQKPRLIKCYCHPCRTCLWNLHQPLHTGPLCTFIQRAWDYFSKTRHIWKPPLQGDTLTSLLRKAVRGYELQQ